MSVYAAAARKFWDTARARELPSAPLWGLVVLSVGFLAALVVGIIRIMATGHSVHGVAAGLLLPIAFAAITILYMSRMKKRFELWSSLLAVYATAISVTYYIISVNYPPYADHTYSMLKTASSIVSANEWGRLVAYADGSLSQRSAHLYDGLDPKRISPILSNMTPVAKLKDGRVYVTFRLPALTAEDDYSNPSISPTQRMNNLLAGDDCLANWSAFMLYAHGLGGFVDSPLTETLTVNGHPFKGPLPPCGQMVAFSVPAWNHGNPG